jgi:SHS2 domain-containing protein
LSVELEFEFVDRVTSDLSFVARGPTLDAVFAAAARALLAATVEDPESVAPRVRRELLLEEPDLELLLLRFLNELVYLRDAEQLLLLPRHVHVSGNDVAHLAAELVGEVIDAERHRLDTEVKAATAHGLRIARASTGEDGNWEASVTLDV